jgi:transcriptional regulator with XRE-family HTH domain
MIVRQVNEMTINNIIENNHISKYRLAKNSGVPYMTINDICSGKANLADCNAKTIYKLSKELGVSMEELLEPYMVPRPAFELFKSNVCHKLKSLGDIQFLIDTIESEDIITYYNRSWYPECLYLLAMVDYISRENDVPLCEEYNQYRKLKLNDTIYPSSVLTAAAVSKNDSIKEKALKDAIPEFIRFNIVESEVRNVN